MTILHIDFNSYFASVEQQANPRLRGKPVGVTGGDRLERTVLCTASIEAKKLGVKTGMQIWEAKKVCPQIIIVPGDSDKYLECSKKFWNILKDYSPLVEIFSIDECFLEVDSKKFEARNLKSETIFNVQNSKNQNVSNCDIRISNFVQAIEIAQEIKARLKVELGELITCSVGISYNKLLAKLAGSLQKPDGLVIIPDQEAALKILDRVELDEICGIGPRIKKRLFNIGIRNFPTLREVPKSCLLASFKSYGEILYNMARGVDYSSVKPFFEKEEVKSIGHRHTIDHDTADPLEIKQILLKISEMVAKRLRDKNLTGKTVHCWYRSSLAHYPGDQMEGVFRGDGMQSSLGKYIDEGWGIFQAAWKIFLNIWDGEKIRMVGVSLSNLRPAYLTSLPLLPEDKKRIILTQAMDRVNNKFGNFTIQKAALLGTENIKRSPNPFLSDRRFKL